jgi:hypothetical protein
MGCPYAARGAISYRDDSDSKAVQKRTNGPHPWCVVYSAGSTVEVLPPESLVGGIALLGLPGGTRACTAAGHMLGS